MWVYTEWLTVVKRVHQTWAETRVSEEEWKDNNG